MTLAVLFLLLSPVELPVPLHPPDAAWDSLKSIALAAEIVGPREKWADDFGSEVRYCREALAELAYAPSIWEAERLPPSESIHAALAANLDYRTHLQSERLVRRHLEDAADEALSEAGQLACLWEQMATARGEQHAWKTRRRALAVLRDRLGPTDWYTGRMPPAVPVWRFGGD